MGVGGCDPRTGGDGGEHVGDEGERGRAGGDEHGLAGLGVGVRQPLLQARRGRGGGGLLERVEVHEHVVHADAQNDEQRQKLQGEVGLGRVKGERLGWGSR